MKKKCWILCTAFLASAVVGLSQDAFKLSEGEQLKNNSTTLNTSPYSERGRVNPKHANWVAHASVNSNRGTIIPGATSGTLNSTVNPSTQLVIPIRKGKGKPNPNVTHDSGIIRRGK